MYVYLVSKLFAQIIKIQTRHFVKKDFYQVTDVCKLGLYSNIFEYNGSGLESSGGELTSSCVRNVRLSLSITARNN